MRDRIRTYFSVVTSLALLLFFLAGVYWINNQFEAAARESLSNYLRATLLLYPQSPEDPESFVRDLAGSLAGDVRVTMVDRGGAVLADSETDPARMQHHGTREEFLEAASGSFGEALRQSETTRQKTMYIAGRWEDGAFLRFSMPLRAASAYTTGLLPVLLFSLLVVFVLASLFSNRLVRNIMKPYERLAGYMETVINKGGEAAPFEPEYEELEPVAAHFQYLAEQLQEHIAQITAKTREIESITASMEEGLVLLDDGYNVLLINSQGSRYLDIPEQVRQKNITHLFRDEEFRRALEKAGRSGQRQILDVIRPGGQTLRFYINPVQEGGFVLLISDVSEIVRLEKMRSEFAANVSHELKTPLTSITGFAELIHKGMVEDGEQVREYAGKIHTEGIRLVTLIDDILRLSSIESGEGMKTQEQVKMGEVFGYVLEVLSPQIKEKGLEVSLEGECLVRADRQRMLELAQNLCDNAVKYNLPGGRLEIRLYPGGFQVSDTGIGIPEEEQERIFERFYRVDKARSRKTGGTGLGLSIAKHIVEQYGGTIRAERAGGKTTFTVDFSEG